MHPMRNAAWIAALAGALLVGAAHRSTAAAPAAPPPSPGLPKGVHPLPPELAGRMDEVVKKAEEYRGLRLKQPVPFGTLAEPGFSPRLSAEAEAELASAEMRALDVSLKAFGLLPEEASAARIYHDFLSEQVAAYYDPERKYLAMVEHQDKPEEAGELVQAFGPEGAKRLREGILAHEVTHALDDQSFGIGRKKNLLSDESAGFAGLVEGDATLVMFDYILGQRMEGMAGMAGMMGEIFKNPGKLFAQSDLPGAASLAKAPAWFSDSLMFSYFQGLAFCLDVKRAGGQKLLDYAFAKDPPRSTEQILHPEKWHAKRDDPIAIAWPSLDGVLPGWTKAAEGQMGEEGILILLRERGKDEEGAALAAAGWGGDRFAVYQREGQRLLLWITDWDSEKDAAEFAAAVPRLGEGWRTVRGAPTRVAVIHGPLATEPGAAVEAALRAAPAERPANRNLDLAALGAVPEKAVDPTMAGVLHNLPSGEVSADGRTFTDRDTGFSIRAPEGKAGWKLEVEPGAKFSVQITNQDGSSQVGTGVYDIGSPAPLEEVAAQIRKAFTAKLGKNGRDLGSELVTRGGTRYFEMRTEIENPAGERTHNVSRVFVQGMNTIVVVAVAPAARWTAEEPVLREILDSLTLLPPPALRGADGHTYTDRARGFSLRVPGDDWALARQTGGMDLLKMTGPSGTPEVHVLGYRSDFVGGLDLTGQSVAAGMKQSLRAAGQELAMQSSGVVEREGRRWYEIRFTREGKEDARRGITRLYLRGKQLFVVTAFAPAPGWAEQEKGILAVLDSFTLTPEAAPAH